MPWSTHHPDPSHGTVVLHRGAQATNIYSVGMDQLSVAPSVRSLRKLLHSMPSVAYPLPLHLHLRPSSPYQQARPTVRTVVCTMHTQQLGSELFGEFFHDPPK